MDRTFIEWCATEADRLRAREIAQEVLDGRTTVLEGVRQLISLAHSGAVTELEDRRFIIGSPQDSDEPRDFGGFDLDG